MSTAKHLLNKANRKRRYWFSRWPVANLLNRSPRTCWADIVTWAIDGGQDNLREINGGDQCRAESVTHKHKSCYCGKFTNGCPTLPGQTPGDVS